MSFRNDECLEIDKQLPRCGRCGRVARWHRGRIVGSWCEAIAVECSSLYSRDWCHGHPFTACALMLNFSTEDEARAAVAQHWAKLVVEDRLLRRERKEIAKSARLAADSAGRAEIKRLNDLTRLRSEAERLRRMLRRKTTKLRTARKWKAAYDAVRELGVKI